MINFSEKDDAAVKWCEEKYPELTQEYKKNYDGTICYILQKTP